MRPEEYKKLYEMEKVYWWHIGRRRIIFSLIEKFVISKNNNNLKIIDIGCGSGSMLDVLANFGDVLGVDDNEAALGFAGENGFSNIKRVDAAHLSKEFDFINKFDLTTCLDVIEHVDDDRLFLKEIFQILKPGGHVLITVPAYNFLWSEHDEALNHKRRYMASELHRKLNDAGFEVIKRSYAVTFLLPLILFYRLFRGIFPKDSHEPKTSYVMLPKPINTFFVHTLGIESHLLKYIDLPFGSSIVCVARKKA